MVCRRRCFLFISCSAFLCPRVGYPFPLPAVGAVYEYPRREGNAKGDPCHFLMRCL